MSLELFLQVKLLEVVRCIITPNREENKKNRMKQKTEIEIELSETVAYSRRSERFEALCPQCKSLVEMTTPQVAAILTRSTEREVYRIVETGKIHFVETDRVLICLKSFTQTLSEPPVATGG
ncbi:hypothetical protein BH24ACI2_BH24ACI2_04790 [soil metagenome]